MTLDAPKISSQKCAKLRDIVIANEMLQPVTEVDFPSVTLCNEYGLDTGEYVRNVLNNLEYTKENSLETQVKQGFKGILVDLVANADFWMVSSNDFRKFLLEWLR